MLLTSYEFLGFIAAVLLLYYIFPKRFQWKILLAASYVFYFIAGPSFLAFILTTTVTTYFAGRRIGKIGARQSAYIKENKTLSREEKKAYKQKMKGRQWRWMLFCLLFNLGILAVVKYANFAISNVNGLMQAAGSGTRLGFLDIIVPMGISFYTFQSMGYLIDVYRGTVPAEQNPFRFALFVSFFPQLVQGPISRFGDLAKSLFEEHAFDAKRVCYGLERVLWGYFKKLVIADRILVGVTSIVKGDMDAYGGAYVFVGMMFYALELYADFTGGIDITIGVAQTFGVTVAENFNRPFFSKCIKEYWNRWHMTMGSWFTDYIFYPISVCKPMLKFSKFARAHFGETIGKRMPVYLSSFAVWLATGIWHGASWNFVVWGLSNWAVIMVSQELEPLYARFHGRFHVQGSFGFRLFQVLRTILLMSCLRIFDCYRDVGTAFRMFGTLFTEWNWHILWDGSLLGLGLSGLDYLILALGLFLLVFVSMLQRSGSVRERIAAKPYPLRFALWYGLFLVVLLTGVYGFGYDSSQFIYNQF